MRILQLTSDWKWTGPAEPMLKLGLRQGLDPVTAPLLALTAMFGYLIASPETPDRRRDLRTMFSLYLRDPTTAA